MSPRVDQRDLARRQRKALRRDGFTPHQIRDFARLFTTPEPDGPRTGCAADTTEEDR